MKQSLKGLLMVSALVAGNAFAGEPTTPEVDRSSHSYCSRQLAQEAYKTKDKGELKETSASCEQKGGIQGRSVAEIAADRDGGRFDVGSSSHGGGLHSRSNAIKSE